MSARRASARSDDEQDCKAIFLSIYNDLDARIKSKEELLFALQQTGRNPTTKMLNSHWKPSTRSITYDDFLLICRRLPATTQDDLMKAFRRMDANGDGFISRQEFMKAMTSKGERMSMEEVIDIIDRVDENRDGKLDYHEFCNLILSNVEDCKSTAKRKMARQGDGASGGRRQDAQSDEQWSDEEEAEAAAGGRRTSSPPRRGVPTAVVEEEEDDDDDIVIGASSSSLRSASSSAVAAPRRGQGNSVIFSKTISSSFEEKEPRNLRRWTNVTRRGSLFLEDIGNNTKAVLTHMYSFSLSRPSHVLVRTSPLQCKSLDIPAPDLNLLLVRNGKPVAFGDQTAADGRATLRADLAAGNYCVYPITSGVKFHARTSQPRSKAKLVKKDRDDKLALTTACKEALSDVFSMADLDGNGYLNKEEFGLYIMRTSGEKLEDSLWEVVEENCNLVRGEITEEDYIKLNLKEAEQDNGDTENLWITFDSMGFNHQLFMDEAFPFQVDFYVEDASPRFKVDVMEIDLDKQAAVDKALIAYVLEKGEIRDLPGSQDCSVAMLSTRCGAVVVAENRSPDSRDIKQSHYKVRSGVWIDIDCANSENLLLGGADGSLKTNLNVKPGRSEIIFWLVPKEMKSQWKISCEVKKRS